MGYVLLAVMFYTIVRAGVEIWLQFRYERNDHDRDYGHGEEIRELKKRIKLLENRVVILEEK